MVLAGRVASSVTCSNRMTPLHSDISGLLALPRESAFLKWLLYGVRKRSPALFPGLRNAEPAWGAFLSFGHGIDFLRNAKWPDIVLFSDLEVRLMIHQVHSRFSKRSYIYKDTFCIHHGQLEQLIKADHRQMEPDSLWLFVAVGKCRICLNTVL